MSRQTLGEFLSLLRKANGYTQQDVAEKLNISNRTLSSWETDRTVPDVLILPAIADLYGVTVDELLRGERIQAEKTVKTEITDKAQKDIRKNRFGKFSSKFTLLCGIAGVCAGLVLLAEIFLLIVLPIWASILIFILGIAGIIICIVLVFYFANGVKIAEGIVLKEDITEDNKSFVLALRNKSSKIFALIACAFLIIAAIFLWITMLLSEFLFDFIIWIVIFNAAVGLGFLIAYAVYHNVGMKTLANDKQAEKYSKNKKLVKNLCVWGIIPVALCWALCFAFLPYHYVNYKYIYKQNNFEEFKKYFETLIVNEEDNLHVAVGIPVGEYELNFPDDPDFYESYDLGNGFTGVYENVVYGGPPHANTDTAWSIYYNNNDTEMPLPKNYYVYGVDVVGDKWTHVVNVRYSEIFDTTTYVYGPGLEATKYYSMQYLEDKSVYAYYSYNVLHFQPFFFGLAGLATLVSPVICIIIYFNKRRKQIYSF